MGLILKLQNDGYVMQCQTFFDCTFFSNYFEMPEKLWIAGKYPIRLDSITMIESAKNYGNFNRGLFLFDAMISRVSARGMDIKAHQFDFDFIRNLIESTLDGTIKRLKDLDPFVLNEWQLFVLQKKEIVLDMYSIYESSRLLSNLITADVVKTRRAMENDVALRETDNALKSEWLALFPSLETVRIITYGPKFAFRLDVLLKTLEAVSRNITVIVEDADRYRGSGWAQKAMDGDLCTQYAAAGLDAVYDEAKGALCIKSNIQ